MTDWSGVTDGYCFTSRI